LLTCPTAITAERNSSKNRRDEEDDEDTQEDRQSMTDASFHWLSDQLAVGGASALERIGILAAEHGIRAVVDLRAEDRDNEETLRAAGIELLHLPTPDLEPAIPEYLEKGVAFVRERIDRGEKVLIHCQHGIGRSPLLALCVLVDQGSAPLDALEHMKNCREAVSPSRSQYEGWAAWLRARGIAPPDYHSFGCIAYRGRIPG
jgi:predicted protein tyrosine phosphatase